MEDELIVQGIDEEQDEKAYQEYVKEQEEGEKDD